MLVMEGNYGLFDLTGNVVLGTSQAGLCRLLITTRAQRKSAEAVIASISAAY